MKRYTLQQCIEIVKIHYKTGENFAKTVRKIKSFLERREAPSRPNIVKIVQNFELLDQLIDVEHRIRARLARIPTNIASVAYSVEENQGLSIPCRYLGWIALQKHD